MEETIKYFQPDITDLKVGYECEVKWHTYGDGINWRSYIVKAGDSILTTDNVRVPYLTKEQIEAEGWEITSREVKKPPYKVDWINAQKGQYVLWINLALHDSMHMGIADKIYTVFRGQCKDINTFRYICKLLNIK